MFRLNQIEAHEAYKTEMLRRAEQQRTIAQALAGRQKRIFYAPMLASFGIKLITWGYALHTRYNTASEIRFTIQNRTI